MTRLTLPECGFIILLALSCYEARGQTFQVGVPAGSVPVSVVCPGGAASQSGNTITCPGSVIPQCPSPPGAGPCGGPISCPGFANTIVLTENWANPQRMFSGPMGPNDIVLVQFQTGNSSTIPNTLIRLAAAEWSGPPTQRTAALSEKPCDLVGLPFPGAFITNQSTITFNFTIDTVFTPFPGYYPVLRKNTVYYENIRNVPGQCGGGDCPLAIDLVKNGNP